MNYPGTNYPNYVARPWRNPYTSDNIKVVLKAKALVIRFQGSPSVL
jgi:hypothetical protein